MLAEKYEDLSDQEQSYMRQLSNASLLIITFLKCNGNLSSEEVGILQSTLAPNAVFTSDQVCFTINID